MHQSAGTITIDIITIAARTIVTTAMKLLRLLKLTVIEEEREGGLSN
jgi:hypothetical protein